MASESRSKVPAVTRRSQSSSYSSAEPSHQWIASGCVSSATSSTQASSRLWVVGAVVVCVTGLAISLGSFRGPLTVPHVPPRRD